jgi:hypothetical protein
MKDSADTPRFVCRVTRGWISTFGQAGAADHNGHVAHCEDCQAYFAADDELERMLRRQAVGERAQPSPMLESKILHAVRRSTAPVPHRAAMPWLSFAGAAAALVLGVVVLRNGNQNVPGITNPTGSAPKPEEVVDYIIKSIPADLFTEMRPQAEAILNQNPLQDELSAVTENARGAVRFLAKNFLTAEAAEKLPQSSRG